MTRELHDLDAVTLDRAERLQFVRAHPELLPLWREHYRTHPADFVDHWGCTIDPRSVAKGRPALVPFLLWPRQRELIEWMHARWRAGEPATVVKSRDVGASWCAMAALGALAIFERGFAGGVASATEVKLDRAGDPDTLFYKLREFLKHLPVEFAGGYLEEKHSSYLRVLIPASGSSVTGEAGDQAGRGGRKSLYVVDESAHFPRPIDAALAATTDCRIDMSSVNGTANSFYERATNPNIPRFDITWRDDPRKDDRWYQKQLDTFGPVIVGAEIDCNFLASTERQLIETRWINSVIGAHYKLNIPPTGMRVAALDVADQGADRNAWCGRYGILVAQLESWSGSGSSIFNTVVRTMGLCDAHGYDRFLFDVVGLGAGVAGDAEEVNRQRIAAGRPRIYAEAYAGSAAPPEGRLIRGRENSDAFANMKAISWWALMERFRLTDRVIRGGLTEYDRDQLIAIDPQLPELNRLVSELSQVTWSRNAVGKLTIDKIGQGQRSPNLADALAIAFSPGSIGGALQAWLRLAEPPAAEQERAQQARQVFELEARTYRERHGIGA